MEPDTAGVWFKELVDELIATHGTQAEVARLAGVTQQTVSNWTRGTLPEPGPAARLASAMGRDVVEFLSALWPDIAEHDTMGAFRAALKGADARERRAALEAVERTLRELRVARLEVQTGRELTDQESEAVLFQDGGDLTEGEADAAS